MKIKDRNTMSSNIQFSIVDIQLIEYRYSTYRILLIPVIVITSVLTNSDFKGFVDEFTSNNTNKIIFKL